MSEWSAFDVFDNSNRSAENANLPELSNLSKAWMFDYFGNLPEMLEWSAFDTFDNNGRSAGIFEDIESIDV